MKRLIRAFTAVFLLSMLVSIIWYHNNRARVWLDINSRVKEILSEGAGNPVSFRKMRFVFPFSVAFDDITVSDPVSGRAAVAIGSVVATPDTGLLLTADTLVLVFRVSDIKIEGVSADITARIDIQKKHTWKEAFLSPEIGSIHIVSGDMSFGGHKISELNAELTLTKGIASRVEALFSFREEYYLLDLVRIPAGNSLMGTLRSKDYTLKASFNPDEDTLIIDSLRGDIFSLNTDISGKIGSISASGKRSADLRGHISGKIGTALSLALKKELPENASVSDGFFTAEFETHFEENDLKNISLISDITASKIFFGNIGIEKISGKVSLSDGLLDVSKMMFFLGPHPASLDLSMSVYEDDLPLTFSARASGVDIGNAFKDISFPDRENYGKIGLDLSFSGSGKDLYSIVSHFAKTGAVYPDGKIFKDMKMSGHIALESYQAEKNRISDIFAEFSLTDGELDAPSISFSSYGGSFKSKAGISFFKEDLPFHADVSIKGVDPRFLPENIFGKNNRAEGPVDIEFFLSGPGTVLTELINGKRQDDTTRQPGQVFWQTLLMDEYSSRLKEFHLDVSVKMPGFYFSGTKISDIDLRSSLSEGTITVPSLFFRSLGGAFTAKGGITPDDPYLPLFFETRIVGIDTSGIPANILDFGETDPGRLDLDLSFTGSGHFLSGFAGDPKTDNPTFSFKNFWRKLLSPEYRGMLPRTKISALAKLGKINVNGVRLENIHFEAGLSEGLLKISSLSLNCKGGTLRSKADLLVDYADFPMYFYIMTEKIDFTDISSRILNSPGLLEGASDIAFTFSGYGSVLSEVSEHMAKLSRTGVVKISEKIHSSLLLLSERRLFMGQKARASFFLNSLRLGEVTFNNVYGNIIFNDGLLSSRELGGLFYRGVFSSELEIDLASLGFPFTFRADVKRSDLRELVRNTVDKKSDIHGNFDFSVKAKGKAEYQSSYTGDGSLEIYDANLGRVPILTPLLGWIYEGLENVFPAFKKINIDTAGASFDIRDRKLITDDLVLSGSDICLVAQGSLDFDGRLDFTFENELIERKIPEDADWPVSVRNFITSFGKTMSRARLKGTLKDQKWEFEYLAPIRKAISSNVRAFFKGISQ